MQRRYHFITVITEVSGQSPTMKPFNSCSNKFREHCWSLRAATIIFQDACMVYDGEILSRSVPSNSNHKMNNAEYYSQFELSECRTRVQAHCTHVVGPFLALLRTKSWHKVHSLQGHLLISPDSPAMSFCGAVASVLL